MKDSFLTQDEINKLGFKSVGSNVRISKYARFYSVQSISIKDNVRIDDFCIISGIVNLGSNVHISAYTALHGSKGITIDDFAGVSSRCLIYSAIDDFSGKYLIGPTIDPKYTNVQGGHVYINKYCQIGASSIVFPNLTINTGAVIGCMSMVKSDIPSWSIYAGIPAKYIRKRDKNMLEYINKL